MTGIPTQQELISCGKELGYVGADLQAYVKEQQNIERDERIARRNAEKEKEERENQTIIEKATLEETTKAVIAKLQAEERDKEREARDKEREEKDKERDLQLTLARLAAENK